jgi:hypothetical protein
MRRRRIVLLLQTDELHAVLVYELEEPEEVFHRPAETQETYLTRVVKRKLISIQREWRAAMRGGGVLPDSLDQPINSSEDGDTLTRGDLLAAPPDRDADLAMDLYRAREKLTERQRLVIDASWRVCGNQGGR